MYNFAQSFQSHSSRLGGSFFERCFPTQGCVDQSLASGFERLVMKLMGDSGNSVLLLRVDIAVRDSPRWS